MLLPLPRCDSAPLHRSVAGARRSDSRPKRESRATNQLRSCLQMADAGGIFHVTPAGELVQLRQAPYLEEAVLQEYLARHPTLIPGGEIDAAEPRRFVLVGREVAIAGDEAGVGRIDHLFVDQDATPTFVEVKRATDTRIRREVVAQLLDYVSNAVVQWTGRDLEQVFVATHGDDGGSEALSDLIADEDPARFWERAETNLRARRVRLIFVADEIPMTLRRIIEFLNEAMDSVEVLAVEIRQYADEVSGMRSLVPRLIGQTAAAGRRTRASSQGEAWTEDRFFGALRERSPEAAEVARRLVDWATHGPYPRVWFGRGARSGSLAPMHGPPGANVFPFIIWTYARVEVQFAALSARPPFDDEAMRMELARRLNSIPGVEIPQSRLAMRPAIELTTLADATALAAFEDAMQWVADTWDAHHPTA
jgi:hypothetical protein